MNSDPIVIVFSCDDRYVQHAAATIASIVAHSERNFRFYILDCGISRKKIDKLQQWDLGDGNTLTVTAVTKNDVFERYRLASWFSPAIFYRLTIADLFPQYDKVLYLDSDVIAAGDVGELWDIELGDKWLGGVDETPFFLSKWYAASRMKRGFSLDKTYFNSGVLLMNTKMMRVHRFADACIRILEQNQNLAFPDQDAVCRVLGGDRYVLCDTKFNFMVPLRVKKEFRDFQPTLMHYLQKPWVLYPWLVKYFGAYGRFAKPYWEAVRRTPFADEAEQYVSFQKTVRVVWKFLFQPIETFVRMHIGEPLKKLWKR